MENLYKELVDVMKATLEKIAKECKGKASELAQNSLDVVHQTIRVAIMSEPKSSGYNDGVWHTLCGRADAEIDKMMANPGLTVATIFTRIKQMEGLVEFEGMEICKETINPMVDYFVEHRDITQEEVVEIYHSIFN